MSALPSVVQFGAWIEIGERCTAPSARRVSTSMISRLLPMKSRYGDQPVFAGTTIRTLSNTAVSTHCRDCASRRKGRRTPRRPGRGRRGGHGERLADPGDRHRVGAIRGARAGRRRRRRSATRSARSRRRPSCGTAATSARRRARRRRRTASPASRLLRTIKPILRCGSTPVPAKAACVRRMKSPVIVRHTNWNSSRVAHMFVPAPTIV